MIDEPRLVQRSLSISRAEADEVLVKAEKSYEDLSAVEQRLMRP
jgi:hypothetical protein